MCETYTAKLTPRPRRLRGHYRRRWVIASQRRNSGLLIRSHGAHQAVDLPLSRLASEGDLPFKWAGNEETASQSFRYDSADLTLSGENGTRRIRTPVASNTAFAIAAATGRLDGSPAPEGAISGWLINTTSITSGACA